MRKVSVFLREIILLAQNPSNGSSVSSPGYKAKFTSLAKLPYLERVEIETRQLRDLRAFHISVQLKDQELQENPKFVYIGRSCLYQL